MLDSELIDLDGIAKRVVEFQQMLNLNDKEFCEKTGIPQSSYSQVKTGKSKLNVDTINKVARCWADKLDLEWFLKGNTHPSDVLLTESINATSSGVNPLLLERLEELGRVKEELNKANQKQIARITVYYTDNTFANYTLSTD